VVAVLASFPGILAVFFNPSGVTSYTHEKIIQIGKPIKITNIKVLKTHVGAPKLGKTIEITCNMTHEITI
jgi:hypothetical protein